MTKHYLKALLLVMVSTLLFSCAAQQVQAPKTLFNPYDFKADQYEPKVDNFMVILDASSSMAEKYTGQSKFMIAQDFLGAMNQTLPALKLNGALRTFGHNSVVSKKSTALFYGPVEYAGAGFKTALEGVKKAGGPSPMPVAINAVAKDLESTKGQIAVIIVSDGKDMGNTPVTAAKNMKSQFGDRLCIHTVLVGDDPAGTKLLSKVAEASGCGFAVRADGLTTSNDIADFVKNVFLAEVVTPAAKPLDSDGDGVTDDLDRCPDTPTGVKVDAQGCPIDTDGDGVYDYLDKCPGTPKGAKVNAQGCWILGGILFDTNKWDIKPNFYPDLDAVVTVLEKNSALNVEIRGHTDNIGKAAYNMKLSESRAKAVMDYLVEKGIDPKRLSAKGFGLILPIAGNDTKEGRAKNRRVELQPIQ